MQITGEELARLSCRGLAVYAGLEGLSRATSLAWFVPAGMAWGSGGGAQIALALYAAHTVLFAGAAWGLWRGADRVGARMLAPAGTAALPRSTAPPTAVPASPQGESLLHRVALGVLGLATLLHGLPPLFALLAQGAALASGDAVPAGAAPRLELAFQAFAVLARLALGAYLVFGAPALADALQRLWASARTQNLTVPGTRE